MSGNLDFLLLSVAILGMLSVALPLAWPQAGHEQEDLDNDLRRQS